MTFLNILHLLLTICAVFVLSNGKNANIVFIFADDLGWNDVSFHGSDQIMTPNIDLLAYSGVALGRYYTHAICTPSRAAFLTGKYSHKTGMQGYPLQMNEDRGIPLSEKLLPQYFKASGYATHLVGKWHVGASRYKYLPTERGFDTYFGHYGGFADYYEYTIEELVSRSGFVSGFSLFNNCTPAWEVEGYLTDVYTRRAEKIIKNHNASTPLFLVVAHNAVHASNKAAKLQAHPEEVRKMRHVELSSRRIFAAMVKKLDDSVGDIVKALFDKGILNNTIIVFASDNGGMTIGEKNNYASNYPLRGIKMSPFEGGLRVVGLVWSSSLTNTEHYYDGYMHVTDWMPTLLSSVGIAVPSDIDGVNQWHSINSNSQSPRNVMYEIDDFTGYGAIIYKEYKLVTGNVIRSYSKYHGDDMRGIIGKAPSYINAILNSTVHSVLELLGFPFEAKKLAVLRNNTIIHCKSNSIITCFPKIETACLYNILEDPCETTDLSKAQPVLVRRMKYLLQKEMAKRIPRKVPRNSDPFAAPSRFNYTWTPWIFDGSESCKSNSISD